MSADQLPEQDRGIEVSRISPPTERGSERFSLGKMLMYGMYGIGMIVGGGIGYIIPGTLLEVFGVPNDLRTLPLSLGLIVGICLGGATGGIVADMAINRWFKI